MQQLRSGEPADRIHPAGSRVVLYRGHPGASRDLAGWTTQQTRNHVIAAFLFLFLFVFRFSSEVPSPTTPANPRRRSSEFPFPFLFLFPFSTALPGDNEGTPVEKRRSARQAGGSGRGRTMPYGFGMNTSR